MSSSHLLDPFIINLLEKDESVLDVACGRGKWGHLINISHKPPRSIIGVDIWSPYLRYVSGKGIYSDVILCDTKNLPLRDSCFETVLACEILEHLEKSDGRMILDELERVCKERIIISTPNVEFKQDVVDENPFQIHLSKWSPGELRRMGYKVRGVGFGLFGYATPPMLVMGLSSLAYFFPEISYLLLAVKSVAKKSSSLS